MRVMISSDELRLIKAGLQAVLVYRGYQDLEDQGKEYDIVDYAQAVSEAIEGQLGSLQVRPPEVNLLLEYLTDAQKGGPTVPRPKAKEPNPRKAPAEKVG